MLRRLEIGRTKERPEPWWNVEDELDLRRRDGRPSDGGLFEP